MNRRSFINHSLVTGATLAAGSALSNTSKAARLANPFKLDYAFHEGMFKNNGGADFIDQIRWAYDQGFKSIEDNGMLGRSAEQQKKIGDTLSSLGMRMGVFVVTSDNWHWNTTLTTGKKEWKDKMVADCKRAVELAKRVNAKWVTVVPGNYERSLDIDMQTANVIEALKIGAGILEPHGITMVLEPLSDNPNLFLRHAKQTYMICKAVGSPSCKILYDIYHMQRNEGDLIKTIDACWEEIAYIQIGDNPGRNEPTTGEINYKNLFRHIHGKGYKGIMGMEHGNAKPGKEGELALIKAYREVDNF